MESIPGSLNLFNGQFNVKHKLKEGRYIKTNVKFEEEKR
jgi:hypothetical protein